MAKHRSLDEDFWTNPKTKRYPWHCRMLLAGLITKIADDEGRFDVEPYGLLDTIFARHDPVTEEDIVADLALLEADETIIVYGQDRQFGFLVSWFRRQNIDSRLRRPSSKPEPPASDLCPVTSGAFIDMLMDDWKTERGVKKAWPVVVCREFCAMPARERNAARKRLEKNRKERFSTELHGKERPDVGRRTLDVGRTKNDVDTQDNDVLPSSPVAVAPSDAGDEQASEKPIEQPPTPPPADKPAKKVKPTEEMILAEVEALRAGIDPDYLDAIDTFLLMACQRRNALAIAPTVRLQYTKDLVKLAQEDGMTVDAFTHGVSAAVNANADNTNYVKKAARGAVVNGPQRALAIEAPSGGRRAPSGGDDPFAFLNAHNQNGHRFIQLKDGRKWYERDWSTGDGHRVAWEISEGNWDEATGCTKTPTNSFCCVDGNYYHPTGPIRWRRDSDEQ